MKVTDLAVDELILICTHLDACSVAALARCCSATRVLVPEAAARHQANVDLAARVWRMFDEACTWWISQDDSITRVTSRKSVQVVAAVRRFWAMMGLVTPDDRWHSDDGQIALGANKAVTWHDGCTCGRSTIDGHVITYILYGYSIVLKCHTEKWWSTPYRRCFESDDVATAVHMDEPSPDTYALAAQGAGDDEWVAAKATCAEYDHRKLRLMANTGRQARYTSRILQAAAQFPAV